MQQSLLRGKLNSNPRSGQKGYQYQVDCTLPRNTISSRSIDTIGAGSDIQDF